jgi:23S rRNA (adenine2030-N6)-methyltransferase
LPPKERRGLLLVDPPFEERDDFEKLSAALADAKSRFETGAMILWHPIKGLPAVEAFHRAAGTAGFEKTLSAQLFVRAPLDESRFNGCGLFIVNPPWTLKAGLERLGPSLAQRLAQGAGAKFVLG